MSFEPLPSSKRARLNVELLLCRISSLWYFFTDFDYILSLSGIEQNQTIYFVTARGNVISNPRSVMYDLMYDLVHKNYGICSFLTHPVFEIPVVKNPLAVQDKRIFLHIKCCVFDTPCSEAKTNVNSFKLILFLCFLTCLSSISCSFVQLRFDISDRGNTIRVYILLSCYLCFLYDHVS